MDRPLRIEVGEDQATPPQRRRSARGIEIRRTEPEIGVLVLSQFLEDRFVHELVGDRADGVGYLLKEKVAVNEPAAERLLHRTQWADDRCVRAVAARQWVM